MSNVLPVKEQKRVWATHRQRFISLISVTFSLLAIVALLGLSPSYVLLLRNRPEPLVSKAQSAEEIEQADATKTESIIAALLPVAVSTSSPMASIAEALEGRPSGITVNRITYLPDLKQKTITIAGTAETREDINALRKELEAKAIYKSVTVPVGDLIGATGNQFTVTLII